MKQMQEMDDEEFLWGRLLVKRLKRISKEDRDKFIGYIDKCFAELLANRWTPPHNPEVGTLPSDFSSQLGAGFNEDQATQDALTLLLSDASQCSYTAAPTSAYSTVSVPPRPPAAPAYNATPQPSMSFAAATAPPPTRNTFVAPETAKLPSATMYRGRPVGQAARQAATRTSI